MMSMIMILGRFLATKMILAMMIVAMFEMMQKWMDSPDCLILQIARGGIANTLSSSQCDSSSANALS